MPRYAFPLPSLAVCCFGMLFHCGALLCVAVAILDFAYIAVALRLSTPQSDTILCLCSSIHFDALPSQFNSVHCHCKTIQVLALLHHSCVWHWNASPCHCVASRFFALPPLYDTTPFRAIARLSQTKHSRGVARTSYAIELNAICISLPFFLMISPTFQIS